MEEVEELLLDIQEVDLQMFDFMEVISVIFHH
jgi:hypothetical protein